MSQRVESFTYSVPANNNAVNFPGNSMIAGTVSRVELVFPNGCAGLLSLQVYYSNQSVIPHNAAQVVVGNNQTKRFDMDDFPTGTGWQVSAVNADNRAHSFTIVFYIDELEDTSVSLPALIFMPEPWGV